MEHPDEILSRRCDASSGSPWQGDREPFDFVWLGSAASAGPVNYAREATWMPSNVHEAL